MIRMLPGLPPAAKPQFSAPPSEGAAEILRQGLNGFLLPSAALFHLFDRMETQP